MRALRTHHRDEREFVRRVDEEQRPQGYRIVGVVESGRVVAVAGFRVLHNLASGDALYVDDLSTLAEARGRGHGRALLDWCAAEGRAARLPTSSTSTPASGPEREDAHRLYLNTRLRITAHHFARELLKRKPARPCDASPGSAGCAPMPSS